MSIKQLRLPTRTVVWSTGHTETLLMVAVAYYAFMLILIKTLKNFWWPLARLFRPVCTVPELKLVFHLECTVLPLTRQCHNMCGRLFTMSLRDDF